MNAVIAELEAYAEKWFGPAPPPYPFRGEDWDETLERLPRTSQLWQRFREYDQARTAFEALDERRRRWDAEQRALTARLEETDPDTTDAATFAADMTRLQILERGWQTHKERWEDLKARAARSEEAWGQLWQSYTSVRQLQFVGEHHTATPGMERQTAEQRRAVADRLRQYEAPQKGQ